MQKLTEYLSSTSYPGRGIYLGKNPKDTCVRIAYFIMGRSINSANRIFVETADGIRTQAFDESKLADPSLIIYAPVCTLGDTTIVTNGDQTDTIYDTMLVGGDFIDALRTREFEPDAPHFTPRISGTVRLSQGNAFYKLSILKAGDAHGSFCARSFFEYATCAQGSGYFIHTYEGDGNPLPSFTGEPKVFSNSGDLDAFTQDVWEALHPTNKVSLYTREICLTTGAIQMRILNKNT